MRNSFTVKYFITASQRETQLFLKIQRKYPTINPAEGEDLNIERNLAKLRKEENKDLNIERNINKLIKKRWYNIKKYPKVEDVAKSLGLSERGLHKIILRLKLEQHREIKTTIKLDKVNKRLKKAS